jgi:hypothetical protein
MEQWKDERLALWPSLIINVMPLLSDVRVRRLELSV